MILPSPISTLFPYTTLFRSENGPGGHPLCGQDAARRAAETSDVGGQKSLRLDAQHPEDRKSTRLNSSHITISYAVFCLKKKKSLNIHTYHFIRTFPTFIAYP